jgi:hypothetical protein
MYSNDRQSGCTQWVLNNCWLDEGTGSYLLIINKAALKEPEEMQAGLTPEYGNL